MIRQTEPDPTEGELDPALAEAWAQALDSVREIYGEYPANPETYRTMSCWLRCYMHAREPGYDGVIQWSRPNNTGPLVFSFITGQLDDIELSGVVSV